MEPCDTMRANWAGKTYVHRGCREVFGKGSAKILEMMKLGGDLNRIGMALQRLKGIECKVPVVEHWDGRSLSRSTKAVYSGPSMPCCHYVKRDKSALSPLNWKKLSIRNNLPRLKKH